MDELFDDNYSICDDFWVLAILLLSLTNKKSDTTINIYFNEEIGSDE